MTPVVTESMLGYHPCSTGFLTCGRNPAGGQCLVGSLTGAVASERVSEALKGSLRMVGNHSKSAKAEGSLTARPTGRAGTKEGVSDPQFIYYLATSPSFRNIAIKSMVGSSGRQRVQQTVLDELVLSVPPLEEQKKISSLLCVLDQKIALNNEINDNLQQQAAAIFRSWFVDCAPFGGKTPDEWENVTLEDITALVSRGITPKYADDTDQIVINQKCIRNHMIDLSLARTHTPKVINEKWLRFGDLLVNSTGDGTLGRAAQVWFQPKNITVDSHVTIARPAKENLIFYIGLWGILHEKEIESLHTGSTGQTELPRDRVKAMELLLPDNDTLDRFNALITPMATAIVANQEENNRLAALRDAILPKLMSGKIDVSAIQP